MKTQDLNRRQFFRWTMWALGAAWVGLQTARRPERAGDAWDPNRETGYAARKLGLEWVNVSENL